MKFLDRLLNRSSRKSEAAAPQNSNPSEPQITRVYAFGDIHGQLDLLLKLFSSVKADLASNPTANPKFVFLGDYIDRGPDNEGVLAFLVRLVGVTNAVCLRGNHEQLLLNFLRDSSVMGRWRHYGALETLESYNVPVNKIKQGYGFEEARATLEMRMPQSHLNFLLDTQLSYETDSHFFCHAGVNPARTLARQKAEDLMWIRQDFLSHDEPYEKIIVHGHTPVDAPDIRLNRINVDTGAYKTNVLSCVVLEGGTTRVLNASSQQE